MSWIAGEIVTTPNPKKRVTVLQRWIQIAEEGLKLQNFNLVFEIVKALQHSAIDRLTKTWKGLSKRDKNTLRRLAAYVRPDTDYARSHNASLSNSQLQTDPGEAKGRHFALLWTVH